MTIFTQTFLLRIVLVFVASEHSLRAYKSSVFSGILRFLSRFHQGLSRLDPGTVLNRAMTMTHNYDDYENDDDDDDNDQTAVDDEHFQVERSS